MVDSIHFFNGAPETLDESLDRIDDIGGPRANNNYPWGWAQAGNTPLKRYKQNTHGGGVRDPLIVHWPARISDHGAIRRQFCHVSDLAPTILEVAGVAAPEVYRGVPQQPVTGTSLAYTFAAGAGSARTAKTVQHFEMLGHRGIYHDGWKAVAFHQRGTSFDDDRWELYHLDSDFSECHDLAGEHPDKLREMVERWWVEAGRHGVLPLDERSGELFGMAGKRRLAEIGRRFVFLPPVSHINSDAAPPLGARSFAITVEVDRPRGDEDGVLVSYGSVTSGICLYVADGRAVFDYNLYGRHYQAMSAGELPSGPSTVGVTFERSGSAATACVAVGGVSGDGESGDGESGPVVEIPGVLRMLSTLGMDIGADPGSPSCDDYQAPFPFAGTLKLVVFEIPERSAAADNEALAAAARAQMSRQ
jgi:arylsulfatase